MIESDLKTTDVEVGNFIDGWNSVDSLIDSLRYD